MLLAQCLGIAVIQPVTSAFLSFVVIQLTEPPHYHLRMPTQVHLLATAGIFAGLVVMISEAKDKEE